MEGSLIHGFPTDNWTRERIAALIHTQFQINYSATLISKLMRKIGFTLQKLQSKSYKQDPQSIREWKEQNLPNLKKAKQEGYLLLYADKASVS